MTETNSYFASYPEDFEPYDRTYLLDRAEDLFAKKKKNVLPNLDCQKHNRKTYIRNIQAIAENSSVRVQETTDSSQNLSQLTSVLRDMVAKFKI